VNSEAFYYIAISLLIGGGTFFIVRYVYRLEQRAHRAEKLLREFLTDGFPETQVSNEEWDSLVERMKQV
jgi:hypothetical protein